MVSVKSTGCEMFAKMAMEFASNMIHDPYGRRCWVESVSVREHGSNSATSAEGNSQGREKDYVKVICKLLMAGEEAVRKVIAMYIESMEKSSGDMVTEAFHENAKVVGYLNGDFLQLSTSDFAGFVSAQEPGAVEFEILSCEVKWRQRQRRLETSTWEYLSWTLCP